jgi:hypothetical protein
VSATALQVATVLGILVGQLTVGIPLALRLNRRERPRRARRATEALADAAAVIIDEWPDDRAAAMLAAWRAERGWRPVLRVGCDARSGAVSRGVMPRPAVQRGMADDTPTVRLVTN